MSVNSCLYWHTFIDATPPSACSLPHSLPAGQLLDELPSLKGCGVSLFFFFLYVLFLFFKEASFKKTFRRIAAARLNRKQRGLVHTDPLQFSLSPGIQAKGSWLVVDYSYQGALVFRQGQTITLCSGEHIFWVDSVCVCVCVRACAAGDSVCSSHSPDTWRWTQKLQVCSCVCEHCSVNSTSCWEFAGKAGVGKRKIRKKRSMNPQHIALLTSEEEPKANIASAVFMHMNVS